MTSHLRYRGFTLIEVLVAMVVMAIMSLMAWQGVDGIARTREANQVRLEQVLRLDNQRLTLMTDGIGPFAVSDNDGAAR